MKYLEINTVMDKYYKSKMIAYIAALRYCPECAREAWKDEDDDQTVNIWFGLCSVCKKVTMVGYIDG